MRQNSHACVSKWQLEGQHGANMYLVYRYLSDTQGVYATTFCASTQALPTSPTPGISAYCEHSLRQNPFISGIIFFGKSLMNSTSGRRFSSGHLDDVQSRTQISLCLALKIEISLSLGRGRSGYEIRWCLQTLGHKRLKSLYPVFMPKQKWKAYCFAVRWKAQYSYIWNSQSG